MGETLVDETRVWRSWAAYLGVSPDTFFAVLDDVIAAGQHHRRVFHRLRPGFDLAAARLERAIRGDADGFAAADLYPDAAPCLTTLRRAGLSIGIAGNVPLDDDLAAALEADVVTSGAEWGVEKPALGFFTAIAKLAGVKAARIAYVGDRLDNDVLPARAAGMVSVFIERGPWGRRHAMLADVTLADVRVRSLAELPEALRRLGR